MNSKTSMLTRGVGLIGAMCFGFAGLLSFVPMALAQSGNVIEEVIVTAQIREQDIQDVPIAIDAFGEDFMRKNGIEDVFDLQFFSPSLVVENGGSTVDTTMKLRGVGTQSSISLESSVGVYIDGVTRSRQASASTSLVDMARVEVVKGPQGTLFGRNAVSGVVQYLSVAPVGEFGGWVSVVGGNYDFVNVKGALNIPLADDVLAARVSGSWIERDGFITNLVSGNKIHDMDRYSMRGQLLWTPTDGLSVRIIYDKTEFDEACCTGANVFDGPGDTLEIFESYGGSIDPPARVDGVSAAFPQEAGNLVLGIIDPTGTRFPNGFPVNLANTFDSRTVTVNEDPRSDLEDSGLSMEINWDLNAELTLTSITAYREFEAHGEADNDYTAYDSLPGNPNSGTKQETFSQELRLTGSTDNAHYVLGAYYFDQNVDSADFLDWGVDMWIHGGGGLTTSQFMAVGLIPGIAPDFGAFVTGTTQAYCESVVTEQYLPFCGPGVSPFNDEEFSVNITSQDQSNWALFGQIDYNVSEALILTFGLRYTNDEKDASVQFLESSLNPGFAFFDPLNPLIPGFDSSIDDTVTTGTLKVSYFLNDDVMLYASYGRGYKAGGFNLGRIGLTDESEQIIGAELFTTGVVTSTPVNKAPPEFKPEYVDAYEIGLKGDFMDSRVRANLSIFVSDFDDFQATAFVGNTDVLANAGALSSNGMELSIQALPTDWLALFTSVSYLDAEYDKFEGGPCDQTPLPVGGPQFCDNSGTPLAAAPKWSWVGSARAERSVSGNWHGFAQVDIRWNDDARYGADNDRDKDRDAYSLVNASLGLFSEDERWEITLWGRNLNDEQYFLGVFNAVGREGSLTSRHSEPRTYGLTLRTNF